MLKPVSSLLAVLCVIIIVIIHNECNSLMILQGKISYMDTSVGARFIKN